MCLTSAAFLLFCIRFASLVIGVLSDCFHLFHVFACLDSSSAMFWLRFFPFPLYFVVYELFYFVLSSCILIHLTDDAYVTVLKTRLARSWFETASQAWWWKNFTLYGTFVIELGSCVCSFSHLHLPWLIYFKTVIILHGTSTSLQINLDGSSCPPPYFFSLKPQNGKDVSFCDQGVNVQGYFYTAGGVCKT